MAKPVGYRVFFQSNLTSSLLEANTFRRPLHSHVLNLMFLPQYGRTAWSLRIQIFSSSLFMRLPYTMHVNSIAVLVCIYEY
jgi:hypothetical protein